MLSHLNYSLENNYRFLNNPKDQVIGVVLQTKDYSQFHMDNLNRNLNEDHAKKLLEKLKQNNSLTLEPILVDKTMKTEAQRLEKLLKADFISALESGRVPLHTTMLSKETIARKEKLGFSFPASKFVASEQFVKDIIFYVRLEKKKWQIADIWV